MLTGYSSDVDNAVAIKNVQYMVTQNYIFHLYYNDICLASLLLIIQYLKSFETDHFGM